MSSQESQNEHKKWSLGKIITFVTLIASILAIISTYSAFKKDRIEDENSKILESQLNEYEKSYVKAHNENDMSYIRNFYNDNSYLYETKDWINRKYNEQLKVDSLQTEIISAPEKINNSNVYTVETNQVYNYDYNGRKGKEKVKGRIFKIEISEKGNLVFDTVIDAGKSTGIIWGTNSN